jgi:hypothetical protein
MAREVHLTLEMAKEAIGDVVIMLGALADRERIKGFMGHLVIMDPNLRPGDCEFENAIFYEDSFRSPQYPWNHDYEKIALAKARESWESGYSSRELMALHPLLVADGDAPWAGSIVSKCSPDETIIIAFSGLASEDDEWVCWMIEARLFALAYKRISGDCLVGGRKV